MTTTSIGFEHGIPVIILNGKKISASVAAYVGSGHSSAFQQAGIQFYTFYVPGVWWTGVDQYEFAEVDAFLSEYCHSIPQGYFMPRIDLSFQGYPWWQELHPEEMNVMLEIETGAAGDQYFHHPRTLHYLGHAVNLREANLHSFYSTVWREEASRAVSALVAHCEAQPYAEQIWGWHVCDGLFCEWFHWNEYSFQGIADYSPAAQQGFRRWLREQYHDDPRLLSSAWGRWIDFDNAQIPAPIERMRATHGDFLDPVLDRPTADFHQSFSDSVVDSIIAVCQAVRLALPQPKLVCVFYGYQMVNMPRPQLCAHYALRKLLDSPAVDMIACPHSYSNRGEGGYHTPQTVADTIRRAGKIFLDEIDCKTVWTPDSVTWKRHISQPQTVAATIEMMKKDAAFQIASGTAQWWMDLTDNGWFDAMELVEPMSRLKGIEEQLQKEDRAPFAEVAFVSSQRAMMFQSISERMHNIPFKLFRNWHLSRMGAPFEQILIDDIGRPGLPPFKLYIMANLFYVPEDQRRLIERTVKQHGATLLWLYAPGFLDDRSASLDNMRELTGFQFCSKDARAETLVKLINNDHPITFGLESGYLFGTGIDRDQYQKPPKIQFMPETMLCPQFAVNDPDVTVLGEAVHCPGAGLALKELPEWRSIYCATPLLPWQLMRNICHYAGVHVFSDNGDMLWANRVFLAVYSQSEGPREIHFPYPVSVIDAYSGVFLGSDVLSLCLDMQKWESRLLFMHQDKS